MAAMTAHSDLNPEQLHASLVEIATGFQQLMNTADTVDGRSAADQSKRATLTVLSNNFNLGCGMLALAESSRTGSLVNPEAVATGIADAVEIRNARGDVIGRGSTINRWYDPKVATTGFAMVNIIEGCKVHSGGRKRKGRRYRQKGGAMPDRYDIFTYILLGSAGAAAFSGLAAAGVNGSSIVAAADYVIDTVVGFAVKMGTFKAQCETLSDTSWNLFKQYTVGQFVPVETCLQKIQYNEAQLMFIKGSLGGLAVVLGGVTSVISAQSAAGGMKAVYNAVKTNISIPVLDAILRVMSQSASSVCSLAARGRDAMAAAAARRSSLRSAASAAAPTSAPATARPAEVQQAAQAQAQAEGVAIKTVQEQVNALVKSGGALTPEVVEKIVAQLKASVAEQGGPILPLAPEDGEEEMKANEGGRRRRRRATRKPRKGKKSKTAKRGRKSKSVRKARKGKQSRKTRRGRK
jgi:hypothetical protein